MEKAERNWLRQALVNGGLKELSPAELHRIISSLLDDSDELEKLRAKKP